METEVENTQMFFVVSWEQESDLCKGSSPYPAVNLRKLGLRKTKYTFSDISTLRKLSCCIVLENRSKNNLWFDSVLKVVDQKKFMLCKIKYGI